VADTGRTGTAPPADLPTGPLRSQLPEPRERRRWRGWQFAAVAAVIVLLAGAVDVLALRTPRVAEPVVGADQVVASSPPASRPGTSSAPTASPPPTATMPPMPTLKPGSTPPKRTTPASNPAPPPAGYPNAANTGVRPGTALSTVNGDFKTTRNGQVVSGMDIHGVLIVNNDNVTVRNSRIRERVDYRSTSGTSLTIEDSDIGPDGCPGSASGSNPSDYPLMYYSGWYTLRRVHLHGDEDLLRTSFGHTVVQDSFLDHTCMYAGAHADAIQQYSPGDVSNVTLIHNTIDGRPANSTSDKGNSAVFWSDHPGGGSSLTAYNNLFAGGNYSVWTTDAPAGSGIVIDIHDNQFVRGSYQYGPHNCANSVKFNGREGVKWSNNTYSDNRQQIGTDC
jgi:hypothetical protein